MTATAKARHPRGLYVLFMTEMWERFSFYLMLGLFPLYLMDSQTGGMGWSGPRAASLIGTYIALVYFTPFLGGIIADRYLGYRKTVFLGGLSFIVGHILLAIPNEGALYGALAFLILGNGLFKPNISTMVGRLYPPDSKLRDNAYTLFYMGINVGGFISNFVAAIVRNTYGWHWAFATAGFGMALGLVVFAIGQRHIRHVDITDEERIERGPQPSLVPLWTLCLLPAVGLGAIGWVLGMGADKGVFGLGTASTAFVFACIPVVGFFLRIWIKLDDKTERGKVGALLAVFGVVVMFWMVFHQNSTALTAWAKDNTDRVPSGPVAALVSISDDFAEVAPPEYFYNAGPSTPRPAPSMFQIVPDGTYRKYEDEKALSVKDGVATPVTADIYAKVFAGTNANTPQVEDGKQLRLVNTELFQSINGGFVLLLAPLLVGFWILLARRGREPSTPAKIGLGLLLTACSALVMVLAVRAAGSPEGKVSAMWLFGAYGVVTIGELCLSPIGMSLVSKHSPRRLAGFLMGGWFLASAIGNKLSGIAGELYFTTDHTLFFAVNAFCVAIPALIIFAILPWLRRQLSEPASVDLPVAKIVKK